MAESYLEPPDRGELPTDCFDSIYPDLCELDPENPKGYGFSRWDDQHLFERASNYEEFVKRDDLSPGTRERIAKIMVGLSFEIEWRIADSAKSLDKEL